MSIDFNGLLDVIKAAEREPYFDMGSWEFENDCGTTHCMVGAFCAQNKDDLKLRDGMITLSLPETLSPLKNYEAVSARFGITPKEALWLFGDGQLPQVARAYKKTGSGEYDEYYYMPQPQRCPIAMDLDRQDAIARLRKFITYKMHKEGTKQIVGRNKQLIDYGRHISGRLSAVYAAAT